jgi:hypothetical protein
MSSSKRLGHKRPKAPKSQSMAKASEASGGGKGALDELASEVEHCTKLEAMS